MYLAFDGPDNAGKSTLIKILTHQLAQHYPDYLITTVTEPSDQLRHDHDYTKLLDREVQLLGDSLKEQSDQSLQHLLDNTIELFTMIHTDRIKQYETVILPFMRQAPTGILLSDHSVLSSLVYQYQLVRHIMKLAVRNNAISKALYNKYIDQLNKDILTPILNYRFSLPDKTYILFGNQNKKSRSKGFGEIPNMQRIITQYFISLYTNTNSNNKIKLPLHKLQLVNNKALTPFIQHPSLKLLQILGLHSLIQ